MDCSQSQWYTPMKRALDLSGKSPVTHESYLRSIRQLPDYLKKLIDRKGKVAPPGTTTARITRSVIRMTFGRWGHERPTACPM